MGEPNYFLLAENLELSTNMNIGQTKRLTDVPLAERQVDDFAGHVRKPPVQSDIKFKQ